MNWLCIKLKIYNLLNHNGFKNIQTNVNKSMNKKYIYTYIIIL